MIYANTDPRALYALELDRTEPPEYEGPFCCECGRLAEYDYHGEYYCEECFIDFIKDKFRI